MGTYVLAGILVLALFWLRATIRSGWGLVARSAAPVSSKIFPLPARYKALLAKYFRYYQGLSPENKRIFEQRVFQFVKSKRFIARGMPRVPAEMALFVAAVAVQLTFGLPHISLLHFNKILMYPDDYYSNITKRYHRGEVNPAFGIIVLSWQHFMEGFLHGDDAMNLGLHEMAHALRLENIVRNEEFAFFDEEALRKLDEWGVYLCGDPGRLNATFFRPYACVDKHEFFSVAVENFFERSDRFAAELPELYGILVKLLHQDPRRISSGTASVNSGI